MATAMKLAQDGDQGAYRDLLRQCVPIVAKIVRSQGISGPIVDDIVQDALLTVHRARATYDPERPFLPWLSAITRRRAIDTMRLAGRRPHEVGDSAAYETFVDEAPGPDQRIEARQQAAHIEAAVARLPAGQRQAVEYLAIREHSLSEASKMTGRSQGALKVNLHRALKALRGTVPVRKDDGDA